MQRGSSNQTISVLLIPLEKGLAYIRLARDEQQVIERMKLHKNVHFQADDENHTHTYKLKQMFIF